eukprot:COSAG01_NODE_1265_length_10990_cov_23.579745_4_plen_160_part_00
MQCRAVTVSRGSFTWRKLGELFVGGGRPYRVILVDDDLHLLTRLLIDEDSLNGHNLAVKQARLLSLGGILPRMAVRSLHVNRMRGDRQQRKSVGTCMAYEIGSDCHLILVFACDAILFCYVLRRDTHGQQRVLIDLGIFRRLEHTRSPDVVLTDSGRQM